MKKKLSHVFLSQGFLKCDLSLPETEQRYWKWPIIEHRQTPLISELWRHKQWSLSNVETSSSYMGSSKLVRMMSWDAVKKNAGLKWLLTLEYRAAICMTGLAFCKFHMTPWRCRAQSVFHTHRFLSIAILKRFTFNISIKCLCTLVDQERAAESWNLWERSEDWRDLERKSHRIRKDVFLGRMNKFERAAKRQHLFCLIWHSIEGNRKFEELKKYVSKWKTIQLERTVTR